VATAADSTSQGAQDTLKAAKQLTEVARQLRNLVDLFKLDDAGNHPMAANQNYRARAAHAS
jgi:hypothetical protein